MTQNAREFWFEVSEIDADAMERLARLVEHRPRRGAAGAMIVLVMCLSTVDAVALLAFLLVGVPVAASATPQPTYDVQVMVGTVMCFFIVIVNATALFLAYAMQSIAKSDKTS